MKAAKIDKLMSLHDPHEEEKAGIDNRKSNQLFSPSKVNGNAC